MKPETKPEGTEQEATGPDHAQESVKKPYLERLEDQRREMASKIYSDSIEQDKLAAAMALPINKHTIVDHYNAVVSILANSYYSTGCTAEQTEQRRQYVESVLAGIRELLIQKKKSLNRADRRQGILGAVPFTKQARIGQALADKIRVLERQMEVISAEWQKWIYTPSRGNDNSASRYGQPNGSGNSGPSNSTVTGAIDGAIGGYVFDPANTVGWAAAGGLLGAIFGDDEK